MGFWVQVPGAALIKNSKITPDKKHRLNSYMRDDVFFIYGKGLYPSRSFFMRKSARAGSVRPRGIEIGFRIFRSSIFLPTGSRIF
jgi:hypothetical protein